MIKRRRNLPIARWSDYDATASKWLGGGATRSLIWKGLSDEESIEDCRAGDRRGDSVGAGDNGGYLSVLYQERTAR